MNSTIFLKDMRFFAYHGVCPQEAVTGNHYVVNLTLRVDISKAAGSDDVSHTVNYAEAYQVVKEEMQQRSMLLEHVASRIVKRLLADFPPISGLSLQIEKLNPPIPGDIYSAGVSITCDREADRIKLA